MMACHLVKRESRKNCTKQKLACVLTEAGSLRKYLDIPALNPGIFPYTLKKKQVPQLSLSLLLMFHLTL